MTEAEIHEVIDGFVASARRAQDAGFDGVEIFAAYNALVDQFWTPWSNRRTDDWGGSFEGRMRFSATILERIRAACGDDFIIGLAVSMDEGSAPALSMAELAEIVAWHDAATSDGLRDLRHGLVLRLLPDHPGLAVRAATGRPVRRGAQARRHARPRAGREPHPHARGRGIRAGQLVRPTWSASCAARSPIRTWSPRPAPTAPRTSGRASRATRCAGDGARATTGSRAW